MVKIRGLNVKPGRDESREYFHSIINFSTNRHVITPLDKGLIRPRRGVYYVTVGTQKRVKVWLSIYSNVCYISEYGVNMRSTFVRFLGGALEHSSSTFFILSFFTCTCPNWSGVCAIDNLGLFEQVFDQYDIPEVPEKNFEHDFSTVCRRKMFNFCL